MGKPYLECNSGAESPAICPYGAESPVEVHEAGSLSIYASVGQRIYCRYLDP